ncbi:MAG: DNA polymerase IV [Candidatus Eisenbacteria sp.]|nr:DNA polymerase IV [Candidatus Eisenbacteria bacterium]
MLHLDVDAFFASVEQLRNPRLQNKPVVVGTGVAASASYEARARGIRAGTPLHEARRLCPEAVFLPGHAPTYRAFARRVFDLAAELSPAMETFLDDALLDLSGTERVHGHLIRAADRLRRRVCEETGLSISLGLATNRMVARMVTRLGKPGGFAWLRPGGEAAFVASRPIEELPGIGPRRASLLREMGLVRIQELRDLSPAQLRDLLGEAGLAIAARARGNETRALRVNEMPRSVRRETSFDQPETRARELEGMLHYLADRATSEGRRLGIEPRRVRIHLRWADGRSAARSSRLDVHGCPTETVFSTGRALLGGLLTRRIGVRNLGIEISRFRLKSAPQEQLFSQDQLFSNVWHNKQLDDVVDGIRERFGFRSLMRGPSLELLDHLPSDAYGFVLRTPCLTR